MRSDSDIKRDVETELRWTPDLDATDIAAAVKDGVVTLTGFVKSYLARYEAERAVKRVAGVRGVANDLEVRLPTVDQRPDPDIARDAVAALKAQLPFSSENIKVVVKDGWVTLEGEVEWNYQRERVEEAVRRVRGNQGHQQQDPASAAGGAERDQGEDRGRVPAQRRARRGPGHGRGARRRGGAQGRGALLGRAAGGRAGRLGGAGRHQGREPDHHQPLRSALAAGG
jgi:osmotically-inducible protein OsmY